MATSTQLRQEADARPSFRERWIEPASPRSLLLWFGIGAPPLALAAEVGLGDLLFELGCSPGVRTTAGGRHSLGLPLDAWAYVMLGVLTLVVAAAGFCAVWSWRRLRGRRGIAIARARTLALGGIASS